jgi:hypothetical protein
LAGLDGTYALKKPTYIRLWLKTKEYWLLVVVVLLVLN